MMKFLIWSTVGLSMAIMMPLRSHAIDNQGTQTTSGPIQDTLIAQKFIPSNLQKLYEDSANSPNRNASNTPSPMNGDRFNNPTSPTQSTDPMVSPVPDRVNNPVRVPNTTTERFDPNAPAPMTTDRINEGSSQPTNMNDPNNRYPGSSSPNQLNNQSPNQMNNPGTVNNQPTTGGEPIQGMW